MPLYRPMSYNLSFYWSQGSQAETSCSSSRRSSYSRSQPSQFFNLSITQWFFLWAFDHALVGWWAQYKQYPTSEIWAQDLLPLGNLPKGLLQSLRHQVSPKIFRRLQWRLHLYAVSSRPQQYSAGFPSAFSSVGLFPAGNPNHLWLNGPQATQQILCALCISLNLFRGHYRWEYTLGKDFVLERDYRVPPSCLLSSVGSGCLSFTSCSRNSISTPWRAGQVPLHLLQMTNLVSFQTQIIWWY